MHTLREKQSNFKLVDLSCCVWKIKSVLKVPESYCCGKAASYRICNRAYFFLHHSEGPTFVSTSKLVLFFALWHLDPNISLLHIYNANRKQ